MTWRQARLSLQLAADSRAGFVMRERERMFRAQQDAAWDQVTGAHRAG